MSTHVLAVRHPDGTVNYTTTGDVHIIDVDLVSQFTARPGDHTTALEFAHSIIRLDAIEVTSPLYTAAVAAYREALRDWDRLLRIIDSYDAERRREP